MSVFVFASLCPVSLSLSVCLSLGPSLSVCLSISLSLSEPSFLTSRVHFWYYFALSILSPFCTLEPVDKASMAFLKDTETSLALKGNRDVREAPYKLISFPSAVHSNGLPVWWPFWILLASYVRLLLFLSILQWCVCVSEGVERRGRGSRSVKVYYTRS